ncbi:MAG: hypothetical protein IKQ10_10115 [Oscillospiraceae bacterium]|nr:hypothetical protein [Oscillospiraceae bacterium]
MSRTKYAGALYACAALAFSALLLAGCGRAGDAAPEAGSDPAPAPESVNRAEDWGVYIDGRFYTPSVAVLPLTGRGVTEEELRSALEKLPKLRRVEMRDTELPASTRAQLREAYPEIVFQWPVTVLGTAFLSTDTQIALTGREDLTESALDELRAAEGEFYDLRTVDLSGCPLSNETLAALDEELGDTEVIWSFSLYGVQVSTLDREIDLSGHKVTDGGAAVEAALPYCKALEKVVMCRCGLSNEAMDELDRRHEDVRFVWMVDVKWASIRTDADFFIPFRASGVTQSGHTVGLSALKYCPDLIALDIGHSHTQDISYVANMRHLKYLVLAENYTVDISALTGLTELKWLEMFQCTCRDISPLLTCTALEDLNICYIYCSRDNLFDTLSQMTWLKRLWCSGTPMTRRQIEALRAALPDTEIWCKAGDESTGATWRYSESYYEMRDAFHMYYMDITGNRTRRLTEEELQKMHDRYWK